MPDVYLFHTDDGGDVSLDSAGTYNELVLNGGLETAAYLSLFGGNEKDDGVDDRFQWWGNYGESEVRQQRSETQNLLRSLPATTGNLRRIEVAAERDLQWFLDEGIADEVEATASLTATKRVAIAVRMLIDGEQYDFLFEDE